jgi:hypothetical protein
MSLLLMILRSVPRIVVCVVILTVAVAPTLTQSSDEPLPDHGAVQILETPEWSVALGSATLRSQPNSDDASFGGVRPLAPWQILGYDGDWASVLNPRTKGTAFVESDLLGPADRDNASRSAVEERSTKLIAYGGFVYCADRLVMFCEDHGYQHAPSCLSGVECEPPFYTDVVDRPGPEQVRGKAFDERSIRQITDTLVWELAQRGVAWYADAWCA